MVNCSMKTVLLRLRTAGPRQSDDRVSRVAIHLLDQFDLGMTRLFLVVDRFSPSGFAHWPGVQHCEIDAADVHVPDIPRDLGHLDAANQAESKDESAQQQGNQKSRESANSTIATPRRLVCIMSSCAPTW